MEALDTANFYSNFNWEVSEDLSLNAQFMYNRQIVRGRQNPGNPGFREDDLPTGGNCRAISSGQPHHWRTLFAEPLRDAGGNIITDGYGQPLPFRGGNGMVALAQNQFASIDADPLGGVPFNEDVRITQWLPFGKNSIPNTLPLKMRQDGGLNWSWTASAYRMAWFVSPCLLWLKSTAHFVVANDMPTGLQLTVKQGLSDVISDVESCFNPFGAIDPRFRGSQQVADSVFTQYRERNIDQLHTFDLILNGELGEFRATRWANRHGGGYQRREEQDEDNPPLGDVLNDQLIGNQELPQINSRYSDSYFAEFNFPILENLGLSASIRTTSVLVRARLSTNTV